MPRRDRGGTEDDARRLEAKGLRRWNLRAEIRAETLHRAESLRRARLAREPDFARLRAEQRTLLRTIDEKEASDLPRAVRRLGRALRGHFLLSARLNRDAAAEEALRHELGAAPPDPLRVVEAATRLGPATLDAPTLRNALAQLARGSRDGRAAMRTYFESLLPRRRSDHGDDVLRAIAERTARIAAKTGRDRGARARAIREEAEARGVDEDAVTQLAKRARRARRRSNGGQKSARS